MRVWMCVTLSVCVCVNACVCVQACAHKSVCVHVEGGMEKKIHELKKSTWLEIHYQQKDTQGISNILTFIQ
jgi:hypothetical protein